MFGRENERSRAGGSCGARPLASIEVRGRERRRILAPVAPLSVGERVDPEVKKERQLVTLPIELRLRRSRARGHGCVPSARERAGGDGRRANLEKRASLHHD
jgi:hypothetical protein